MEPESTIPENNLGALPPLPDETPGEFSQPASPVASTPVPAVQPSVAAAPMPVTPAAVLPPLPAEVPDAPIASAPAQVETAVSPVVSVTAAIPNPVPVQPVLPSTDLPQLPSEAVNVPNTPKRSNKGLIIALIVILLLVAGVVIFILASGTTLFGINASQTAEQDTARKTQLQTIATAVVSEYSDTRLYPAGITTSADKSTLYVGSRTVSANGALKSANISDANGTRYCYLDTGIGYKLGAKLSDGTWYDIGTSTQKCSDADLIFTVKSAVSTTQTTDTTAADSSASVDTSTADTVAEMDLRNTVRHSATLEIATAVNSYYSDNGVFPASLTVSTDGTSISVNSASSVTLSGAAKVGAESDKKQTRYCYALVSDGFKLGAKLEDGNWYNIGSSTQLCTDTDTVLK